MTQTSKGEHKRAQALTSFIVDAVASCLCNFQSHKSDICKQHASTYNQNDHDYNNWNLISKFVHVDLGKLLIFWKILLRYISGQPSVKMN